jgi:sugar (pentulose or hexulose) kinase
MRTLSLGIDLGTSGIRSAVVDEAGFVLSVARAEYGLQDPDKVDAQLWWEGVVRCITNQVSTMQEHGLDPKAIARIGVDGTSGSMVLTDAKLTPVTRALMYNSSGFMAEAEAIARYAPDPHITRGSGSALGRMMRLQSEDPDDRAEYMLHQADFISAKLMGQGGWSDENNALKTGYDPEIQSWPAWAGAAGVRTELLPKVKPAGSAIASIASNWAAQFGLSDNVVIHAGTTDSIAAFLACAPLEERAAVTSLGTTLAIKLLSPTRIDAPDIGLYSHKIGDHWLVGGASNTGGGVLQHFFTVDELRNLSSKIDAETASELDYYPLLNPGERFPIKDPNLEPCLTPRPESDAEFLHGMMESIARIEAQCYDAMRALQAPQPKVIYTAGGGASNPVWTAIRKRVMGLDIQSPIETEAAVGIARLIALA